MVLKKYMSHVISYGIAESLPKTPQNEPAMDAPAECQLVEKALRRPDPPCVQL